MEIQEPSPEFILGSEYEHVDIVALLEQDHKPLKDLIHKMRDHDLSDADRLHAFQDFMILFETAARAEEAALYEYLKLKSEFRAVALHGEIEHLVIGQMCEEIRQTEDDHARIGKIEVLAQIAANHIHEEEQLLYPSLRDDVKAKKLERMARTYIMVQTDIIASVEH